MSRSSASKNVTYRFGVGSPEGNRSGTWGLWTNYRGSDVYLSLRLTRGTYKVSLHGCGHWRIAHPLESGLRGPAGDRALNTWKRPPEWKPGWTTAFEIWIPRSEVVPPMPELEGGLGKVNWTPPPDGAGDPATVFGVWLASDDVPQNHEHWPGRRANGSEVLVRAPLGNGETAWLLRMQAEIPDATRERLEEARTAQVRPFLKRAAAADADAVVGRTVLTMMESNPELGSAGHFELALQAFKGMDTARAWFDHVGGREFYREALPPAPPGEAAPS